MAAYWVLLLGVLLGPASVPTDGVGWIGDVAARLGAPDRLLVPSRVEFVVNVGVIAPAAALGSVVWPRTTWRDWTAYGFLLSASIELTQGCCSRPGPRASTTSSPTPSVRSSAPPSACW